MTQDKTESFEHQMSEGLDESLHVIPGHIQSELTKRRHLALQQLDSKRKYRKWYSGMGAFASLMLVAVLLYQPTPDSPISDESLPLEMMLADGQDMEIAENYEFMLWLMEEQDAS